MLTDDKDKVLFLLGGHDLEMMTIRNILQSHHYLYSDKQLRWDNALLSHYQQEIGSFLVQNPEGHIIGIELENDLQTVMPHYLAIDHHNDNDNRPCALEQILNLLQIPTSRQYQLIAANDSHYIPGMLALKATREEINAIRLADRQAQGVTQEEESMAEKAIAENLKQVGDLIIVQALSSCFSPICDRLFPYHSLLIYTDKEWVYYGQRISQIQNLFQEDYSQGKLFRGGGPNGYIGIKKGIYSSKQISEFIKQIEHEFI